MKASVVVYSFLQHREGQEIFFPKEDLVVNKSGIAKMSNPNSKIDRIKIETKKLKVI